MNANVIVEKQLISQRSRKWELIIDDLLKNAKFDANEKLIVPEKAIPKNRFSLKRWWKEGCAKPTLFQRFSTWYKEGNEKVRQNKLLKSER